MDGWGEGGSGLGQYFVLDDASSPHQTSSATATIAAVFVCSELVSGDHSFVFTHLASSHHQSVIIVSVERLPIPLAPILFLPAR